MIFLPPITKSKKQPVDTVLFKVWKSYSVIDKWKTSRKVKLFNAIITLIKTWEHISSLMDTKKAYFS